MNNAILTQSASCAVVQDKYLTFRNLPYIYINHLPNPKEFMNNAFWRLTLDALVEHFIPGLGTQPFYKEVVYNIAGVPSALSSSFMGFNIGQTNNTYGPWHAVYAICRAAGKITLIGTAAYQDPSKITTKGALEEDSKTANYVVDTIIRWVPFHAEKIQIDRDANVYTPSFYGISMASGWARTYGSQTGGKIVKSIEKLSLSDVIDSSRYVIEPIKTYIPATINYLNPVEAGLSTLSNLAKDFTFENIVINNFQKLPILDIVANYLSQSILLTRSSESTISQIKTAYNQGVTTLFTTTSMIIASKLAWNFFSSLILIPSSRIVGVFFEDTLTCLDDMRNGKSFYPPEETKDFNREEVKLIENIQQQFDEF